MNLPRDVVKSRLTQFAMAGAMHVGFFDVVFSGEQIAAMPYAIPWYYDRFAGTAHALVTEDNRRHLGSFSDFICNLHFPWWRQIFRSSPKRVRLLNPDALETRERGEFLDLTRLANLLHPDTPSRRSADKVDQFFTDTVRVAKTAGGADGPPAYAAILAAASERFYNREYKSKNEEA
jgi:hypothetical protein